MSRDIEQRLRDAHPESPQYINGSNILLDAAEEIARLRAENRKLKDQCVDLSGMLCDAQDRADDLRDSLESL